jgi:hypothetical protein
LPPCVGKIDRAAAGAGEREYGREYGKKDNKIINVKSLQNSAVCGIISVWLIFYPVQGKKQWK